MKAREFLLTHDREFLAYCRSRFPVYHMSNVFFRDIQYAVIAYLGGQKVRVSYTEAEHLARSVIEKLEREKLLHPVDHQTWAVDYPEFRTPTVKAPAAAAKSAA